MSVLQHAIECLAKQSTHEALNAFVSRPERDAILRAVRAAGDASSPSPLTGRLIAIKDNICTLDSSTTCGSALLRDYQSPYEATVVTRLTAAGAVVAGKTNLDEFGMGSHSIHSAFGSTAHPLAPGHSPGGSSSGSTVAVASHQCLAALGTDTGGSVRLPASYCGVVGFKPSYGRLSRRGVVAYANSLDTVGVLARSVADARTVYEALDAHDSKDPTSLSEATRSRIQDAVRRRHSSGKLRVGVPREFNSVELQHVIRRAWARVLKDLVKEGHEVVPVSLPSVQQALSAYYVIAPAEASSNLARYDGARYGNPAKKSEPDASTNSLGDRQDVLYSRTRGAGLGREVRHRILLGAYSLSASAIDNYFIQAQQVRRLLQADFDRVFRMQNPLLEQQENGEEGVDILLSPTAPTLAPKLAEVEAQSPLDAYRDDVMTVPASLAGLPAMSVPVSLGEEAEVKTTGMQVTGQFGDEEMLFRAAEIIEGLK